MLGVKCSGGGLCSLLMFLSVPLYSILLWRNSFVLRLGVRFMPLPLYFGLCPLLWHRLHWASTAALLGFLLPMQEPAFVRDSD